MVSGKSVYYISIALVWAALWESFDLLQLAGGLVVASLLLGRFSHDPSKNESVRERSA